MEPITLGIMAGTTLVGGAISAYGAGESARAQAQFEKDKLNENKRQFNQNFRENKRQFDVNKITRDAEFASTMDLQNRSLSQADRQFTENLEENRSQFKSKMSQEYKMFTETQSHNVDMFGLQVDENRRQELFTSREKAKDREETQRQFDLARDDRNEQFDIETSDRRRGMRSSEKQQGVANAGYNNMLAMAGR